MELKDGIKVANQLSLGEEEYLGFSGRTQGP